MATSYKTPGVFVEEIPKLPPSVAQVETALPAFVGYTNKADEIAPGDLINKPKRIGSLVEFEQYYGSGSSPDVTEVNIDSNNNFTSAIVKNNFFMVHLPQASPLRLRSGSEWVKAAPAVHDVPPALLRG